MNNQLKDMIKLLDTFSLESIYFSFNRGEDDFVEAQWLDTNHWTVRHTFDDGWRRVGTADVTTYLKSRGVDMQDFEYEIRHHLLQQAVFSATYLDRITALLGPEVVECAKENDKAFKEELIGTIESLLKPTLTVIK